MPWVTIAIAITNVLVLVLVTLIQTGIRERAQQQAESAFRYLEAHPYLEAPPPLDRISFRPGCPRSSAARAAGVPAEPAASPPSAARRAEEQAELDTMAAALRATLDQAPAMRFGYVPAKANLPGLITHQFMHAGVLHLLFNLWFLWLAACVIEDVWGRPLFLGFYLVAGILAALAHAAGDPSSTTPLVGASGAVAGAMGAFFVRYATTRIRFLYFILFRPRFFTARAYVMLPLWFIKELAWGMMDTTAKGGVAYFAHAGGFAFGVLAALAIKYSGLERRIDVALESESTKEQDPRITALARKAETGQVSEALVEFEALSAALPNNPDVFVELARTARLAGDPERAARAEARLIEVYLRQGWADTACAVYDELVRGGYGLLVAPALRLRIARQFERSGASERAAEEYVKVYTDRNAGAVAPNAVIAHAELARRSGSPDEARALYRHALKLCAHHPELEAHVRKTLDELG